VAKVEWRPISNDEGITFSGMYEQGSQHAILRLSETRNLTEESDGLLPSMAIKFLIDNRKSENLFAMPNMTGLYENEDTEELEPSWDFFKAPLKSRVDRPTDDCHIDTLERKLVEANSLPYATSVIRPAAIATDGKILDTDDVGGEFRFPYQLDYEGLHHFPNDDNEIWYDRLKDHFNSEFNEGADEVPILNVFGWSAPKKLGGKRVPIA